MSIHLFKDAALTQQISEGTLTSPDSDTYNGTDGESKDRELYLANEQTTLAADITSIQTGITLASARFIDGDTIIIGTEQMIVTAGGGTTSLTVQRGQNGTAKAAHTSGTPVYSALGYTTLKVKPVDASGTDESSWCKVALTQAELDTATPGAELALGDKAHDITLSFWRRFTVPAGTPVQNKTDLKLRITGTEAPV
ncbi:MAG: hypothetical protein M1133_01330 [Armatimonadetes bacterium]|nr:hypothetical protein [Armatimonadota bacterium]